MQVRDVSQTDITACLLSVHVNDGWMEVNLDYRSKKKEAEFKKRQKKQQTVMNNESVFRKKQHNPTYVLIF